MSMMVDMYFDLRWLQASRADLIFPYDYNFSLAYDKVQLIGDWCLM